MRPIVRPRANPEPASRKAYPLFDNQYKAESRYISDTYGLAEFPRGIRQCFDIPAVEGCVETVTNTAMHAVSWTTSMSDLIQPLTELERDALAELSNIAMARAASSLRQMVGHQVLLSVPQVDIVSKGRAGEIIGSANRPALVAVRQDFDGPFAGRALLIFPEANSFELVRLVVGRELPLQDVGSLEDEALAETGNVILNSWIATIANLLKQSLKISLPIVLRGNSEVMLKSTEAQKLVLFLHIRFEISAKEIEGYVALLMDIPSIEVLRALLTDLIGKLTR